MATLSTGLNLTSNAIQPKTVYAGVLNKKGAVNKAWKKRWFVLYENRTLAYYASQNDVVNCKSPLNCIDLSKITTIRVVNKPVTKPKTPKRRQTNPLNKSKSIGTLFSRNKTKARLTVNGYNVDADKSLTSISVSDVAESDDYPHKSSDLPFSTQFSFELVSPKRTYILCCYHAASFNEWIDNLESAIFGKQLYKGWLTKQGERRKTWKKRWFIIFNTKEMRYYEDDGRASPKGSIFLTDLLTMRLIADAIKYDYPNILELYTPNRIWVLSAENKENRALWWQRISSMIPQSHQITAIYEDHLFKYDTNTDSWIYRYFALDTKHLYQFDKIEHCERYRNCTYFDEELYAIDYEKYVQNTIHLTMHPIIKRINNNKFNKDNVFKIETDIDSFYFCSDHSVQIDRWFTAFNKIMSLRKDNKTSQQRNTKPIYPITDLSNRPYFVDDDEDDEIDNLKHMKSKTLPTLPNGELRASSAEPFDAKNNKNNIVKHRQYSMDIKIRTTPLKRHKRKRTLVAKHPDMSIVSALLALGFTSVNACKRAALAVNNMSCESAANWLWSNMERPEIHEALIYSDEEVMNIQQMDDDYNKYYADIMDDDEFRIFSDEEDDAYQSDEMEYLNEIEMKQIEDIPEYGLKADTFFRYKIWDSALKYYNLALEKEIKDRNRLIYNNEIKNECVYKWYCYRSECYRRLKRYPEAVSDTMSWMDIVFNDDSFCFVEGCEIASGIWMDLRRFAAAKIPIERGLKLNPTNKLLSHRLKTVHREIAKELAHFSLDIDRKHLELNVDIEEKCDVNLLNDVELRAICDGWFSLISGHNISTKEIICDDISSCKSASRLVFVMRVYGTWCSKVTQTDDIEFVSMYDILSMLHSYGIHHLLNDYIHIIDNNINNTNWLKSKCSDCFSKEIAHKIEERHFRDKTVIDADNELRAKLYFGYNGSSDIVTFSILDNIYHFIFYSDSVIFDDENMHFKLSSFITKHRRYIKRFNSHIYDKYISNIDKNELSSIDIGKEINKSTAKYATLKQELLDSTLSTLEWNDVLCKAKWFKKTYKASNRNWGAIDCGYLNEEYEIKANQPISLTHLIVLLLYTNNDKLRGGGGGHFNLLFEQCLLFYSKRISSSQRFYHAISCSLRPILFNCYILNSFVALSITRYYSVAMMSNYDLVLSLKRVDSRALHCLDVSYLSDRAFEGEYIVKNMQFSICNIYDKSYLDYDIYMNSLLLFSKMINGEYLLPKDYHSSFLYQEKIVECMDCLSGRNSMLATPKYIQSMFNYLISSTPALFLIKSQYEHLTDDIWNRLLMIDKNNNKYKFGDFLSLWKSLNLKSAQFVNEYIWNEQEFGAFWCLKSDEQLIGPKLIYPQNKENIVFEAICKRINSKLNKNVAEFGIKCCTFPYNKSKIYLKWNLFCPKAQFKISTNIYITKKDNYQFVTFPIQLMHQMNTFQFQIALRIFNTQ